MREHPQQRALFDEAKVIRIEQNILRERRVLDEWIRPEKAASFMQVSVSTIYRYINEGRLVGSKPTQRTTLVKTESIFDLLERSCTKPATCPRGTTE